MEDTDVPPSPGPIRGLTRRLTQRGRFILQHFKQDNFTMQFAPHNQNARFPGDMSNFPNAVIMVMFYGCAVLLQWGMPQATDVIQSTVESSYHNEKLRDSSGEDSGEDGTAHLPTPEAQAETSVLRGGARVKCQ